MTPCSSRCCFRSDTFICSCSRLVFIRWPRAVRAVTNGYRISRFPELLDNPGNEFDDIPRQDSAIAIAMRAGQQGGTRKIADDGKRIGAALTPSSKLHPDVHAGLSAPSPCW